jgi:hypothetical protein
MSRIQITTFHKPGGILSKRISLSKSGTIISDGGECRMAEGKAYRVNLNGTQELAKVIDNLGSDEALALGRLRDGLPDRVDIVAKRDLVDAPPNTVARSNDWLQFAPGQPAFMLLDHDHKGMPREVAAKMKKAGGFWKAVNATAPLLSKAAGVSRPSTSSGLYNEKTGKPFPGSGSRHVYLRVKDGSDIERATKTLHERLWLADFGYFVVGRAGQFLDRSIIDAAVYGPERLVFEGKPILEPPIGQDHEKRRAKVFGNAVVDTKLAIPDLTDQEKERLAELKAAAKERLQSDAIAKHRKWTKELAKRRGLSRKEAEQIATAATSDHILYPELELEFDDTSLGTCTVAKVLDDPEPYLGKTLADPIEGKAYGRNKAMLFRGRDTNLKIQSFVHGGIEYRLKEAIDKKKKTQALTMVTLAPIELFRTRDLRRAMARDRDHTKRLAYH